MKKKKDKEAWQGEIKKSEENIRKGKFKKFKNIGEMRRHFREKQVSAEESISPEAFEKFQKKALTLESGDVILDEKKGKTFLKKRKS